MSSNSKKTISFTVESEEEKRHLQQLADFMKFQKLSDMARLGFYQYLRRNKIEERFRSTARNTQGENKNEY